MVSVVIPALNEERNIRASVLTVMNAAKASGNMPLEIIIVNDGSADRTGEIADKLAGEFSEVRVVHHETNRGMGAAISDGIRLARFDLLTMVPGDNAVAPYTLQKLFTNRNESDYVLAVIMNTEHRSAGRIFLSAMYSLIYTTTFGLPIKYINAPGLWPVARLRKMRLRARRYSVHAEINVKLLRQPISFLEVDGYMNPENTTSAAVRFKNVVEAAIAYIRLFYEIFVADRKEYAYRATRVLPPGVADPA